MISSDHYVLIKDPLAFRKRVENMTQCSKSDGHNPPPVLSFSLSLNCAPPCLLKIVHNIFCFSFAQRCIITV